MSPQQESLGVATQGLPPPYHPYSARLHREGSTDVGSPAESNVRRGHTGEDEAWRDAKFEHSGVPNPAEGELTVVIEYCYNSGGNFSQLTTKHGEHRYHEEAELVKQYFCNYHSGAIVYVLPIDFRTAADRRCARLGAFEVDARLRVDGRIVTHSLWSKLHTGQWPQWPSWQDHVHHFIPVFHLRLRPAALRTDGSRYYLRGARVQVLNHDRNRLVADQTLDTESGQLGVLVRMLRGTYTLRVAQSESDNFYPEDTILNLTRVPLPHSVGPIELLIPMRAKPRLAVTLFGSFDADGNLDLVRMPIHAGLPFSLHPLGMLYMHAMILCT